MANIANAQKVEFGGGFGPTLYKGDLQPKFRPLNPSVAGDIFFRYNFNKVLSAKLNTSFGEIKGDDSKSGNPYLKNRDFGFSHMLLDTYVQMEYNFLNFRTHTGRYEYDWTPYFFGGIGYAQTLGSQLSVHDQQLNESRNFGGIIVPFGIGVKKIIGPRLNISAEYVTKVFTNKKVGAAFDGLNGLDGDNAYDFGLNTGDPNYNQHILPNTVQKDKYFQLSVSISYLIYSVKCNTPGSKHSFF